MSRKIHNLSVELRLEDSDLETFVMIDLETDDMPVDDARKLWNEYALKSKDDEIKEYLNEIKPQLIESCKNLVTKLSD